MKENIIINEVGLRECFQNLKKLYRLTGLKNKQQVRELCQEFK